MYVLRPVPRGKDLECTDIGSEYPWIQQVMGYLRDLLLYLEPALLPELATYETEIFAGTVLASLVTFVCESA